MVHLVVGGWANDGRTKTTRKFVVVIVAQSCTDRRRSFYLLNILFACRARLATLFLDFRVMLHLFAGDNEIFFWWKMW